MDNLIFKNLDLSSEVLKAIDKMGFEEATPIQSQGIPPILAGNDVIAQSPTGTGKTCAFGIPLIEKIDPLEQTVQGLILCPTRELVLQTTEELQKIAHFKHQIKILPIYGGQQIERQIFALKRKPQIVVATPGRMMDHLRRKTIKIDGLSMIILDEADEMLNMGFREDIDIILETVPENRQTVLFSATLSKEIIEIANKYQKNAVSVKVTHREITIPTISQYYVEARGKNKIEVMTRLIEHYQHKLCLVFCNTKKMVDELTDVLIARSYSAEALHGDMKQAQRDKVMARFRKGAVDILVATDVAARGIDVDNIEAVFNYDIPNDEEYYVHRIGRTGRAKKTGVSYTFVSGKEMYKLRDIMRYTKSTIVPLKAPSVSDVESTKVNTVLQKAKDLTTGDGLNKYVAYIEKMIEDDETDELTTLDIAAAFLKMTLGDDQNQTAVTREFNPQDSETTGAERGMARLFINVGRMDKLEPRHLIEAIATNSGMEGKAVGMVDIFDKYSFVEVPLEYVDEVIASLDSIQLKGRKVIIEKANKRENKKGTVRQRGFKRPYRGHSSK